MRKIIAVTQLPGDPLGEDFERIGAHVSALQLELPKNLPMEEWAAIGSKLCRIEQVTKWWIADWAAYGLGAYGKLKEFADINGLPYQTLANLAWLAGSIEVSRRRESLDISKHMEVAALPATDQDKWLCKAEKDEWSVAELRRQIRQAGGQNNALEADAGPAIRVPSRACDDLTNWLKTRPEGFWDEDRRGLWKQRLKPIVSFYEAL